jgi:ribonuclease-3
MLWQPLCETLNARYQKQLNVEDVVKVFPKALALVKKLEDIQGHTYETPHLPLVALLHRSALVHWPKSAQGNREGIFSNECLEFLGDSFLNYMVAFEAMANPKNNLAEGDLSRLRSTLVCTARLSHKAQELGLGTCLLLGPKVEASPNVLADTFEAVTAALLISGGPEKAWAWLRQVFEPELQGHVALENLSALDAKSELQQWVQGFAKTIPTYQLLETKITEKNQPLFAVGVFIGQKEIARGVSANKRHASQKAAERAWKMIQNHELTQDQALKYLANTKEESIK